MEYVNAALSVVEVALTIWVIFILRKSRTLVLKNTNLFTQTSKRLESFENTLKSLELVIGDKGQQINVEAHQKELTHLSEQIRRLRGNNGPTD